MMMHVLIDFFAIIGAMCFACMLGFAIIWAISGALEKKQITRPLPVEPMPVTAPLKEVY